MATSETHSDIGIGGIGSGRLVDDRPPPLLAGDNKVGLRDLSLCLRISLRIEAFPYGIP